MLKQKIRGLNFQIEELNSAIKANNLDYKQKERELTMLNDSKEREILELKSSNHRLLKEKQEIQKEAI